MRTTENYSESPTFDSFFEKYIDPNDEAHMPKGRIRLLKSAKELNNDELNVILKLIFFDESVPNFYSLDDKSMNDLACQADRLKRPMLNAIAKRSCYLNPEALNTIANQASQLGRDSLNEIADSAGILTSSDAFNAIAVRASELSCEWSAKFSTKRLHYTFQTFSREAHRKNPETLNIIACQASELEADSLEFIARYASGLNEEALNAIAACASKLGYCGLRNLLEEPDKLSDVGLNAIARAALEKEDFSLFNYIACHVTRLDKELLNSIASKNIFDPSVNLLTKTQKAIVCEASNLDHDILNAIARNVYFYRHDDKAVNAIACEASKLDTNALNAIAGNVNINRLDEKAVNAIAGRASELEYSVLSTLSKEAHRLNDDALNAIAGHASELDKNQLYILSKEARRLNDHALNAIAYKASITGISLFNHIACKAHRISGDALSAIARKNNFYQLNDEAINAIACEASRLDCDALNVIARYACQQKNPDALTAIACQAFRLKPVLLNFIAKYARQQNNSDALNAIACNASNLSHCELILIARNASELTSPAALNAIANEAYRLNSDALMNLMKCILDKVRKDQGMKTNIDTVTDDEVMEVVEEWIPLFQRLSSSLEAVEKPLDEHSNLTDVKNDFYSLVLFLLFNPDGIDEQQQMIIDDCLDNISMIQDDVVFECIGRIMTANPDRTVLEHPLVEKILSKTNPESDDVNRFFSRALRVNTNIENQKVYSHAEIQHKVSQFRKYPLQPFFSSRRPMDKLHQDWLFENKKYSPELQNAFDTQFGLIIKPSTVVALEVTTTNPELVDQSDVEEGISIFPGNFSVSNIKK